MNGLEDATVDSFDCDVVMQKNDGHCALRGSRSGHLHLNFLITKKLGHYLEIFFVFCMDV